MNENKINEITKMLCSEDKEIKKLAVKILETQFDLDFTIYGLIDLNKYKHKYSLNIIDDYCADPFHAKSLIYRYISNDSAFFFPMPQNQRLIKNFIEVIIEYNERKQNK